MQDSNSTNSAHVSLPMATILSSADSETITLAVAFTLLLVTLLFALLGLCTSLCCYSNLLGGKSAFLISLYIISTCALCLSGASGIASLSHDNPRVSSGAFGVVGISLREFSPELRFHEQQIA